MKYKLIDKTNYNNIDYVSNVLKEYFNNDSCEFIEIFTTEDCQDFIFNKDINIQEDKFEIFYNFTETKKESTDDITFDSITDTLEIVQLSIINDWLRAKIQHDKLKEELMVNDKQTIKRIKI